VIPPLVISSEALGFVFEDRVNGGHAWIKTKSQTG